MAKEPAPVARLSQVSPEGRLDCLIIGGGPAGLTAALYLARFRRRFMLVDGCDSRAAWIPASHNFPVFSEGVGGKEMLRMLRAHVSRYGVQPIAGLVDDVRKGADGFVAGLAHAEGARSLVVARHVLLATGATDIKPSLPDLAEAMRRGLLRYCPICDGYEARGKKIAVIGFGEGGLGEAVFVARTYAEDVTLLTLGQGMVLTEDELARLAHHRIRILRTPAVALEVEGGRIAVRLADGGRHVFDTVYSALGLHVRSELGVALGAAHDGNFALTVDEHNQTSVPGLYAAGDTVHGLNQIVVAMGHAAVAATTIHNRCELPTDDD